MTDLTDRGGTPRLAAFNALDPAHFADPFPVWAQSRREMPAFFDDTLGYWQLTRHDDIVAALRMPEVFSSAGFYSMIKIHEQNRDLIPDGLAVDTTSLVNADPPTHTQVRKVCDPAFRKSRITALSGFMVSTADTLIDGFVREGHADLVAGFSAPFPLLVIARILGLPSDPRTLAEIKQFSDEVPEAVNPLNDPARQREVFEHYGGFYGFCRDAISHARANPSDSLLSAMVVYADADPHGTLDEATFVSAVAQMIFAGHETTRNMISHTLINLLRHPKQLDRVRRDPSLTSSAIEESLRLRGAISGLMRVTTRAVEIGNATIPAGSVVQLCFASGNRDETVFPDPDLFDIDRPNANRHMAFGRGAHVCIGAPLARLELAIAVDRLLARLEGLRLTREPVIPQDYVINPTLLGINRLDIEWDAPASLRSTQEA